MRDTGHNDPLQKRKQSTQDIKKQQKQQDIPKLFEINTAALYTADLGHKPVENFGCGIAELFRADDGEDGAADSEQGNQDNRNRIGGNVSEQFAHGSFKILCFFSGNTAWAVAHGASGTTRGTSHFAHFSNSSFDICEVAICW